MSENVKINIDFSAGTIQIDCPETAFENTLSRVEEFLPKLLALRSGMKTNETTRSSTPAEIAVEDANGDSEASKGAKRSGKRRPPPVYKMSNLGVDDNGKREFKKFFDSKIPKNQNDQVLLCAFWLNKTLKRDTFTDDDVYTALRTAGAPKIPSRIESVISNLKLENQLVGDRGKYKITHIGEDYVNNDLPGKEPEA